MLWGSCWRQQCAIILHLYNIQMPVHHLQAFASDVDQLLVQLHADVAFLISVLVYAPASGRMGLS
jgi:hypothetical protein